MPEQLTLLDICERRHRGNDCSRTAHRKAAPGMARMKAMLLGWVRQAGDYGLTSRELALRCSRSVNCISGRLSELKRDGLIIATDRRRDGCAVLVAVGASVE